MASLILEARIDWLKILSICYLLEIDWSICSLEAVL